MLIERNENKKEVLPAVARLACSPKRAPKSFKENQGQVNTKELLAKASKAPLVESSLPSDDLRTAETNKIANDYLKKILANELSKCPENFRRDFLPQHRFGWEIRARMVV
jgi:hypothetical protein